jgi:hypothetical protein
MLCVGWDTLPEDFCLVLELQVRLLSAIQVQVDRMHLIDIFLNCFDFFTELLVREVFVLLHLVKVAYLTRERVGAQEFDRSRAKLTTELHDQLSVLHELLEQAICLHAFVDKSLTALSYLHFPLQLPEVLLWLDQALQTILEPVIDYL